MFIVATVLASAGSVPADVVLPEGVDEYRIIFVTSGSFYATNTDIDWYNTQVAVAAASNPILDGLGADWYCVGSTDAVDARDNISPGIPWDLESVPIYNTGGSPGNFKVGDSLADIFDGIILAPVAWDETGELGLGGDAVYTGSTWWGTAYPDAALGDPSPPIITGTWATNDRWITNVWSTGAARLYGISSPIPEPTTVCLLGFGSLALLRRSRRRPHSYS